MGELGGRDTLRGEIGAINLADPSGPRHGLRRRPFWPGSQDPSDTVVRHQRRRADRGYNVRSVSGDGRSTPLRGPLRVAHRSCPAEDASSAAAPYSTATLAAGPVRPYVPGFTAIARTARSAAGTSDDTLGYPAGAAAPTASYDRWDGLPLPSPYTVSSAPVASAWAANSEQLFAIVETVERLRHTRLPLVSLYPFERGPRPHADQHRHHHRVRRLVHGDPAPGRHRRGPGLLRHRTIAGQPPATGL